MFALGAPAATDSLLCYVLMSKSGGNIALPPAKPERDQIIAASFPVFVTAALLFPAPAHMLRSITYDQVAIIPQCKHAAGDRDPRDPTARAVTSFNLSFGSAATETPSSTACSSRRTRKHNKHPCYLH